MEKKPSPTAAMIDELGDLEAELAPLKAKIARADAIKAALRGLYKDSPGALTFLSHGQRFSALIGVMGNVSLINVVQLYRRIGPKAFLAIATVTIKAITEKCAPEVLGEVVSISASGTRSLTIVPKLPEAKPAAKPEKKAA